MVYDREKDGDNDHCTPTIVVMNESNNVEMVGDEMGGVWERWKRRDDRKVAYGQKTGTR
jgi:hypothetical protein